MSKVRVATLLLALQTLFAPFASSANACEVKVRDRGAASRGATAANPASSTDRPAMTGADT